MSGLPYLSMAINDTITEIYEAHDKHQDNSMFYASPDRALTILTEEVGEVAHEINDAHIAGVNPYHAIAIYEELCQVAAMALTMAARAREELADALHAETALA